MYQWKTNVLCCGGCQEHGDTQRCLIDSDSDEDCGSTESKEVYKEGVPSTLINMAWRVGRGVVSLLHKWLRKTART